MTGSPPELLGALHETVTNPSPEIARTNEGAADGPNGMAERMVGVPSPWVVTGVMRNRYVFPFTRPRTSMDVEVVTPTGNHSEPTKFCSTR